MWRLDLCLYFPLGNAHDTQNDRPPEPNSALSFCYRFAARLTPFFGNCPPRNWNQCKNSKILRCFHSLKKVHFLHFLFPIKQICLKMLAILRNEIFSQKILKILHPCLILLSLKHQRKSFLSWRWKKCTILYYLPLHTFRSLKFQGTFFETVPNLVSTFEYM